MARLFRRSHPRATCLRFEAISLGCARRRHVGEKCQKRVSRLWRVRTFDLETIPRMQLFTAEMVIKVEVNGGMAAASLRQAIRWLTENPSVAWNRACTRALWNFRKGMSARRRQAVPEQPSRPSIVSSVSENQKPETFSSHVAHSPALATSRPALETC